MSNIVSLTMGERYSKYFGGGVHPTSEIKLNQPVKITFVHQENGGKFKECAYWNIETHRWSSLGCKMLESNATHSICGCPRLATFALLASSQKHSHIFASGESQQEAFSIDILVGIMAAIILVLLLVVIVILACYCRKRKVLK